MNVFASSHILKLGNLWLASLRQALKYSKSFNWHDMKWLTDPHQQQKLLTPQVTLKH